MQAWYCMCRLNKHSLFSKYRQCLFSDIRLWTYIYIQCITTCHASHMICIWIEYALGYRGDIITLYMIIAIELSIFLMIASLTSDQIMIIQTSMKSSGNQTHQSTPNRKPSASWQRIIVAEIWCGIVTFVPSTDDPSERTNLADQMPDKVKEMSARLDEYFDEAVSIDLTISAMPQARSYGGTWQPGWCPGMF